MNTPHVSGYLVRKFGAKCHKRNKHAPLEFISARYRGVSLRLEPRHGGEWYEGTMRVTKTKIKGPSVINVLERMAAYIDKVKSE